MPCYHPLSAKQSPHGGPLVFRDAPPSYVHIQVPCGQCIGCRLEQSRQWAMRCVHEASLHENNSFITLTYNDDNYEPSLNPDDLSSFIKRLRSRIAPEPGQFITNFTDLPFLLNPQRIKFFACGEYGDQLSRPHFHACIFGFDFPDRVPHSVRDGVRLFRSKFLEDVWPFGFSTVGDLTFESAAYVARYVVKKVNGDKAYDHYSVVDGSTGELNHLRPEFIRMSRGGRSGHGIAYDWYKRFSSDLEKDYLVMRGVKMRPAKYYDRILHDEDIFSSVVVKRNRKVSAKELSKDNTPDRLIVKETIKRSKLKQLKRGLHNVT